MRHVPRLFLALLFATTAVLHVLHAEFVEGLVPSWLPGPPAVWNVASTAAEGTCAVLLAREPTARTGGIAAFVTLLVVWVANLDHVRRGGIPGASGWLGTREAAVVRAPLQVPLLWLAWRVAKGRRPPTGEA